MTDANDAAMTIGKAIVVIAIVAVVLSTVVSSFYGVDAPEGGDIVGLSGGSGNLEYGASDSPTVNQSLGQSARLDANSSLGSGASADVSGNWSLTTWARLNSSVDTENATRRVIRLDDYLFLDFNEGQWRAVYYDSSSLNSYATNVSAGSPTDWTYLEVSKNATSLRLETNNSNVSTVALTDGNAVGNLSADPWVGSVDETRLYDTNLTANESDQLYNRPTAPLPADQNWRIMYDSFDKSPSSYPVFRESGSLRVSDVDRADGFDEEATVNGTDYVVDDGTLKAKSNGSLDGAPAAYVFYDGPGEPWPPLIQKIVSGGTAALQIMLVAAVLFAGVTIIDMFGGGRF